MLFRVAINKERTDRGKMIATYTEGFITIYTVLTACLLGTVLMGIWCLFARQSSLVRQFGPGPGILVAMAIVLRMYLPFRFHFTSCIYWKGIWNRLCFFLEYQLQMGFFSISVAALVVEIWAVGTLLLMLRKVVNYCLFARSIARLEQVPETVLRCSLGNLEAYPELKKIRVVLTNRCGSPYIMGIFHAVIVLPDWEWDLERMSGVLRHELSHYRHHDLWKKAVMEALETALWWNPLVRVLRVETFRMMEIRNDLRMISGLANEEKAKYLECLVYVASKIREEDPEYAMAFTKKSVRELKERMELIAHPPRHSRISGKMLGLFSSVLILSTTAVVFVPTALRTEWYRNPAVEEFGSQPPCGTVKIFGEAPV